MTKQPTLGNRIAQSRREKAVRERRDITQLDVAKAVGVSGAAVSDWEADKKAPREAALAKLAAYLGVTPQYLRYGVTEVAPPTVRATVKTYTPEEIAAFKRIVAESEGGARATDDPPRRRRSSGS